MFKIPKNQEYIISKLQENGFDGYIVGGCVRDMALGIKPFDYDVTTNALPQDIIDIFEKTIPTGIKHGTITVLIDGEQIEVTTFRTETEYSDSRRPDKVEFVTDLSEDLSRRDFTVNAMAYNEKSGLVDLFGGINDLENKILRAVGDPEKRFTEDALRILRLFRFSARLRFSIEEETLKGALDTQKGLEKISRERIFSEIYKTLSASNPKVLTPLIENGGLEFLKITKIPDFDLITRCGDNEDLRFFVFLLDSSNNPTEVLKELKPSNALLDYFVSLEKLLKFDFPKDKFEIKEMLNLTSIEVFKDYLRYSTARGVDTNKAENLLTEITENREPYKIGDLEIGGKDLLNLGFSGKDVGTQLEIARKTVSKHPEKNNKTDLLNLLKLVI